MTFDFVIELGGVVLDKASKRCLSKIIKKPENVIHGHNNK